MIHHQHLHPMRFIFKLQIECGSGTYMRSLGRDIGERLGCGATMNSLNRSAIGEFSLNEAAAPHEVTPKNIESLIKPPIQAVAHLPGVEITAQQKALVYDGRPIEVGTVNQISGSSQVEGAETARLVLVDSECQLVAVSSYRIDDGTAKPDMVFHDPPRD